MTDAWSWACFWEYLHTDRASYLATTLGVPLALLGGWLALLSYRADKQSAANAHMHGLFKDYLQTELESHTNPQFKTNDVAEDVAGLKLYTLEEMYVWIRDQEQQVISLHPWEGAKKRQCRKDALNGWRATIHMHAKKNRDAAKASILDYTTCYSVEFLEFVNSRLGDSDLAARIAVHRKALDQGKPRPPGNKE